MKELSPPWHRPSVKCAGAGEGLLGQLERRIGKPGETRRRKVTGLSRSLTTGQGRYVRRTASGKPGETRRRKVTGLSCSLTSGRGRYVRRTANGKPGEIRRRKVTGLSCSLTASQGAMFAGLQTANCGKPQDAKVGPSPQETAEW